MQKNIINVVVALVVVLAVVAVIATDSWGAWVEPITGTATLVLAGAAWWESRRSRREALRPVQVILRSPSGERELPLHLTRGATSRAEVLGRIGMMPMAKPGSRFALNGLATKEFLEGLNAVAAGDSDVLEIDCSSDELAQFDWEKIAD